MDARVHPPCWSTRARGAPAQTALEVDAPRTLPAPKTAVSTPASWRTSNTQRRNVAFDAEVYGLVVIRKSVCSLLTPLTNFVLSMYRLRV